MNDTPANENTASNEQAQVEAHLTALRQQVVMHMNALRGLFHPKLKLTFLAIDHDSPETYVLLTEEGDMKEFGALVATLKNPQPVVTPETEAAGNA